MTDDRTPDLTLDDARERADAEEARLFLEAHPEFYANRANGERLMQRAVEICGNVHPFLMDYEAAYKELSAEGGLDARPEPTEPTVVQKLDNGIIEVPSHCNTGTLTIPASERERLRNVPLGELNRMADRDRHASLSETRRKQIRASEI